MAGDPISKVNTVHSLPPAKRGVPAPAGSLDKWVELMTAAQEGHRGAYHRLLKELSEWLLAYFGRRLPPSEVDDAVQETLLAIHRRRHTYDPSLPFAPWLSGIARRKWVDQLRAMGRRSAEELPDDLAIPDHEAAVTSASVLGSLLDQLRPAQAQAVVLVKLQGFSVEDASQKTGLSVSAVKMNIHRGLIRLVTILERNDDVD